MPEITPTPFSYRDDPAVPPFDDSHALYVFDGTCVLCSTGASWLMRVDRRGRVKLTPVASPLGQALYRHYGVDWNGSYLLVEGGRAYTATAGFLRLCAVLGGAWHLLRVGRIVPERLRDAAYACVARHRYRWFGKVEHCTLLTQEQRARLL